MRWCGRVGAGLTCQASLEGRAAAVLLIVVFCSVCFTLLAFQPESWQEVGRHVERPGCTGLDSRDFVLVRTRGGILHPLRMNARSKVHPVEVHAWRCPFTTAPEGLTLLF